MERKYFFKCFFDKGDSRFPSVHKIFRLIISGKCLEKGKRTRGAEYGGAKFLG